MYSITVKAHERRRVNLCRNEEEEGEGIILVMLSILPLELVRIQKLEGEKYLKKKLSMKLWDLRGKIALSVGCTL